MDWGSHGDEDNGGWRTLAVGSSSTGGEAEVSVAGWCGGTARLEEGRLGVE